jgi:hypothetical protein
MRNQLSFVIILLILLTVGLGCSTINPFSGSKDSGPASNKSLTDKGVDVTVGRSKIGVPECDEVMDLIEAELNNQDDNFVTKAVKATVLNRIKDGIRDSVEKNKGKKQDTVELAKTCKEFRVQFEKYKAEEKSK